MQKPIVATDLSAHPKIGGFDQLNRPMHKQYGHTKLQEKTAQHFQHQ